MRTGGKPDLLQRAFNPAFGIQPPRDFVAGDAEDRAPQ